MMSQTIPLPIWCDRPPNTIKELNKPFERRPDQSPINAKPGPPLFSTNFKLHHIHETARSKTSLFGSKERSQLSSVKNSAFSLNDSTFPTTAGLYSRSRRFKFNQAQTQPGQNQRGRVTAERAKSLPQWPLAKANTDKGCWHANGAYIFSSGQEEYTGCRFGACLTAVEMGKVFHRERMIAPTLKEVYSNTAHASNRLGDYYQALELHGEVRKLGEAWGDDKVVREASANMGNAAFNSGEVRNRVGVRVSH